MKTIFTFLKSMVATTILSHPQLLAVVMQHTFLANALLTPARVVVLVSNQSFRKR